MQTTIRPALTAAGLGVAMVVAAGLLDTEPLYVPGVAFVSLALGALAWVAIGARGIRVERSVAARRVVEEEPLAIEIVVSSPRPLPSGAVLDPLLDGPAPLVGGRRTSRVRIAARFGRRGRRVLEAPRVAVRDPLGLVTVIAGGGADAEVLVLPRLEAVRVVEADGAGGAAVRRGRPSVAAEIELDGVRPLREGTSASRIFWPSIAKGAEPMERRLRADSDTRPLVLLDPRGAAVPDDEDAAVRAAASLAVHLARAGGCALLVPGDRRPAAIDAELAGWPHIHARLALVTGTMSPALAGLASRRGPIFYVTARRGQRAPRALEHAPGGGRILVAPGSTPGRGAIFTVAGCIGYELGAGGAVARASGRARAGRAAAGR